MNSFSLFWQVLMTPSDYADDPYSEASNQLGHIALGSIFSLVACIVWFLVFGEMPVRWEVWAGVVVIYAVMVEAWLQGWAGRDSFADTFFVQCGATMTLMPVKEVAFAPDLVVIEFRPQLLGVLMLASTAALMLHLRPRIIAYFEDKTDDG